VRDDLGLAARPPLTEGLGEVFGTRGSTVAFHGFVSSKFLVEEVAVAHINLLAVDDAPIGFTFVVEFG
jgi:hypothetical protein